MIFLDTNVCIDILRGINSLESLFEQFTTETFAITSPSVFELWMGYFQTKFLKKRISNEELKTMEINLVDLLSQLVTFSLDNQSANNAASVYMTLKRNGLESQVFDCLIAGIILANDYSEILTHNPEHFWNINGLNVNSY